MNLALYGGTFDPIHCGHLAAAQAVRERLALDRVYFVPSGHPPHRPRRRLTPYEHRYAMVTLACAGQPGFVPSLAEAPSEGGPRYSIETVRRFRRGPAAGHELFFILGADAFLEFRTWRQWRALLDAAHFVIVSRPGFPLEQIAGVFPAGMVRERRAPDSGLEEFRLRKTTARVLAGVREPVSGTRIRERARLGRRLAGLVPPAVADYIRKQHLYES